jgi:hypothetical protein
MAQQKTNVIIKWDVAADPAASFRQIAEYLHEQSKKRLLLDGIHAEMIFVFKTTGDCLILLVGGDRDAFVAKLKAMIRRGNVVGVIHIAEVWIRIGDQEDHTTKQILDGEIGISDLRPEHRGEALMVMMQSRDRDGKTWIEPILRDEKGKPYLGIGFSMAEIGGRFGNLFGLPKKNRHG